MAYERILVAIDLSDEAEDVLAAAVQEAAAHGNAELHLINVIKPIRHADLDATAAAMTTNVEQVLHVRSAELMGVWAKEFKVAPENVHIKIGKPATEIRDCAEKIKADLIVIGTHGRHGLGLLLGSTANGVLHGVTTNVLTVRIQDKQSA